MIDEGVKYIILIKENGWSREIEKKLPKLQKVKVTQVELGHDRP